MAKSGISIRDTPPDLPDGYYPSGLTGNWQIWLNHIAWYIQRKVGLEELYKAHNFTTMLTLLVEVAGAILLYTTPYTGGLLHWILLALCVPVLPVALFVTITTVLVIYEKE